MTIENDSNVFNEHSVSICLRYSDPLSVIELQWTVIISEQHGMWRHKITKDACTAPVIHIEYDFTLWQQKVENCLMWINKFLGRRYTWLNFKVIFFCLINYLWFETIVNVTELLILIVYISIYLWVFQRREMRM